MNESVQKILMIVGVIVLLGAIVFGAIWYFKKGTSLLKSEKTDEQNQRTAVEQGVRRSETTQSQPVQPQANITAPDDSEDAQLKRFAIDFVARFGTYSTDAPNGNLTELLSLMGPTLKKWSMDRLSQPPQVYIQYQGVTTKSLSAQIDSQNSGAAKVIVKTQRMKTDASGERVVYEVAMVDLVKSGGEWLVDNVDWSEIK